MYDIRFVSLVDLIFRGVKKILIPLTTQLIKPYSILIAQPILKNNRTSPTETGPYYL
jgi:hypothetical protein